MANRKFPNNFTLWKAKKTGNGAAISLSPSFYKSALYLRAAAQIGDARKFDWTNAVTVKLSQSDIGELLAVARGLQSEADLYHKSDAGVTVLKFNAPSGDFKNFSLYISKKTDQNADKTIKSFMTMGESVLFMEALSLGFQTILNWQTDAQNNAGTTSTTVPADATIEDEVTF